MGWAEMAQNLADGAERARAADDQVAFIALSVKAAECALIARLLGSADKGIEWKTTEESV